MFFWLEMKVLKHSFLLMLFFLIGLLPLQGSIILLCLLDITHLPHSQDHLFKDILFLLIEKELLHHLIRGQ